MFLVREKDSENISFGFSARWVMVKMVTEDDENGERGRKRRGVAAL